MPSGISLSGADDSLQFALDGLSTRQRTIANNVANVDTPNFKGSEVSFENQLQRAASQRHGAEMSLVRTDVQHFDVAGSTSTELAPEILPIQDTTLRNDGNNVDIDREMVKLADTQIRYNAAIQMVSQRYSILRSVISGNPR
jgi:flagellar basal-body rod protein FlgB